MPNLSRRVLLGSIAITAGATAPLAALPSVSPVKQVTGALGDVELLRLIPELDQLEAQWLAQVQIEKRTEGRT